MSNAATGRLLTRFVKSCWTSTFCHQDEGALGKCDQLGDSGSKGHSLHGPALLHQDVADMDQRGNEPFNWAEESEKEERLGELHLQNF